MTGYLLRRLAWIVVVLVLVSAVTFVVFYVFPSGDPALLRAGKNPSPQVVENIRQQYGLDRSAPEQFWLYAKDVALHFDFGTSFQFNAPVRKLLFDRLPATIYLAVGALIVWLLIAIPIGVVSALRRGSWFDRLAMGGALLAISAPVYWLGLVLLYLFADDIGVIPIFPGSGSYVPPTEDFGAFVGSLVLPWITLAASFAAVYARVLRASLLETMSEDYIRTARAKGLRERTVVVRHGLRSAMTPIVTLAGLDLGILLGGTILVEYVFNIPGLGRLAFSAIERQDLPVIQGTVLLGALFIVVMTLVVDLLYALLDPDPVRLMALLEVEDLRVGFDTRDGVVHAVDGVSLRVDRGRVLAIVGESGSGKTVTALTLLGLTRSPRTRVAGRAVFDGRDLLGLSDDELRRVRGADVAMIFQDPLSALHPLRRIETQLVEAVRAHRDVSRSAARDRAAELLGQVGIPDVGARMRAYPHQLSGGMRQRVMIAMALVNDPRLLIADEPTTALDVTVQAQILDLLLDLRDARGMAIVLVTHDLGVVAETADDVAVMYGGRIVEQAPVETLFDAPEHPYTWGLLRSLPGRDGGGELVPIPGAPPSLVHRPTGCHFHPRCAYVREAHRTTDPPLEATPGDGSHAVRCLLPAATRRQLWAEQRSAAAVREERT